MGVLEKIVINKPQKIWNTDQDTIKKEKGIFKPGNNVVHIVVRRNIVNIRYRSFAKNANYKKNGDFRAFAQYI